MVLWSCGLAVLRSCGAAVLRSCGAAVLRSCGAAVLWCAPTPGRAGRLPRDLRRSRRGGRLMTHRRQQCAMAGRRSTLHSALFRVALAKCSRRGDSGKRDSVRAVRNRSRRSYAR
ncbi:hypothetical protein EOT10_24510 [Streptomyces antnestii]|uniref:Uncharacterized protein n=1 Tax=Streptomyces antnestii TaxID=2494256 RepID=A0A3S2W0F4_9ACTN|nr:hypothetical protein EOT10_24510 [Streptomyces sp. San01]